MSAFFDPDFFILPAPEYKLQVLSCMNAAAETPEDHSVQQQCVDQ